MKSFSLVLVAAGASRRMGCDKLLLQLSEATVLERSFSAFFGFEEITEYIVVTSREEVKEAVRCLAERSDKNVVFAEGGGERSESVQNGLACVTSPYVLIHDAARPFVSDGLIRRVLDDTARCGASVPALPVYDSVRVGKDGKIIAAAPRDSFYRVQTPQGFVTEEIKKAYGICFGETDESGVLLAAGIFPHLTEGEESNKKLTRPEDVFGLNAHVGFGFDVHRMVTGREFVLGGIVIPNPTGEEAHSDGDVLLHSVMDALLSAAELRDIGQLFPDGDVKYKNISSVLLLKEVVLRVTEKGKIITGISATVALEKPRLAPYIAEIVEKLRKETGAAFVNVSATTTEKLGIVGAGGIAAYAVATLL